MTRIQKKSIIEDVRSSKAREFIEEEPPKIVRFGTMAMIICLIVLLICLSLFKFGEASLLQIILQK